MIGRLLLRYSSILFFFSFGNSFAYIDALLSSEYFSILRCAEGEEGRRLLAKAGAETKRLQPPLNFVPWIMINEKRSSDAFYDLKKNLCDTLNPVPDQCKEQE